VEHEERIYDVGFFFFRNGWKPHKLPVFLLQYVPHQIILMQTLHNDYGQYSAEALAEQNHVRELLTQTRELLQRMQAGSTVGATVYGVHPRFLGFRCLQEARREICKPSTRSTDHQVYL
jgi:hypothetical protein